MPMPHQKPIRVGFVSLGCAKNLVDSQTMAGELIAANIELAPTPEEADVVIVNTCAFIDDARTESMEAILSACELKRSGRCRAVVVAGCMPQRYRDSIQQSAPEVDAFIGLDQLDEIGAIVPSLLKQHDPILHVSPTARKLFEPTIPVVFSGGSYAYLKIAEGCNHACAFCAIPGIRGTHRSRTIPNIRNEAAKLLESGFRELAIISQDTTSYGRDRSPPVTLSDLLDQLTTLDGEFWIRLLYGYPSLLTDELLETIAASPHICNYLDIPIQHSHPDILTAMRRRGTVSAAHALPERTRRAIPDVALRTTCIVGFPGETDAHFQHLLDYVAEARFDHLGVFVYSPEEGTPAFNMNDVPAHDLAQERAVRLMAAQREIVDQLAEARIGTEEKLLLERHDEESGLWLTRSVRLAPEADGIVFLENAPPTARIGDFVTARYTEQDEYDMVASHTTTTDG